MSNFKSDLGENNKYQKLYFWIGTLLPLLASILMGFFILIFFKHLPSLLPLFYSLPWGEQQLANHQQFFIIPGSLTLIALANFVISKHLHQSQSFFKKALLLSSFVSTIILTAAFLKIVSIFL